MIKIYFLFCSQITEKSGCKFPTPQVSTMVSNIVIHQPKINYVRQTSPIPGAVPAELHDNHREQTINQIIVQVIDPVKNGQLVGQLGGQASNLAYPSPSTSLTAPLSDHLQHNYSLVAVLTLTALFLMVTASATGLVFVLCRKKSSVYSQNESGKNTTSSGKQDSESQIELDELDDLEITKSHEGSHYHRFRNDDEKDYCSDDETDTVYTQNECYGSMFDDSKAKTLRTSKKATNYLQDKSNVNHEHCNITKEVKSSVLQRNFQQSINVINSTKESSSRNKSSTRLYNSQKSLKSSCTDSDSSSPNQSVVQLSSDISEKDHGCDNPIFYHSCGSSENNQTQEHSQKAETPNRDHIYSAQLELKRNKQIIVIKKN